MNSTPSESPNPQHQSDTSDSAITLYFECQALSADHPEIQARERERLQRLEEAQRPDEVTPDEPTDAPKP